MRPHSRRPESTKIRGDRIEDRAWEWWSHPSRRERVRILKRNYRCKFGEVDLVLEERVEEVRKECGGSEKLSLELVFVEVRAREAGSWVSGLESVTFPKQMKLRKTIERYLVSYHGKATRVRCDVMEWDGVALRHIPNAWRVF